MWRVVIQLHLPKENRIHTALLNIVCSLTPTGALDKDSEETILTVFSRDDLRRTTSILTGPIRSASLAWWIQDFIKAGIFDPGAV